MTAEGLESMEWDTLMCMDADLPFLDRGFQYYIAARCAARAHLSPVSGNLYHHAIEMFLKARLSQTIPLSDLKSRKFSHGLKSLWDTFKAEFPSAGLNQFDALVDTLHEYESIRYPDTKTASATVLVIAWDRNAAVSTGVKSKKATRYYEVVVSELDELIAKILELSSRNPAFFTNCLNDYASEALKYRNAKAGFFFP